MHLLSDVATFRSSFSRFSSNTLNGLTDAKLARIGQLAKTNNTFDNDTATCEFADGTMLDFPAESFEPVENLECTVVGIGTAAVHVTLEPPEDDLYPEDAHHALPNFLRKLRSLHGKQMHSTWATLYGHPTTCHTNRPLVALLRSKHSMQMLTDRVNISVTTDGTIHVPFRREGSHTLLLLQPSLIGYEDFAFLEPWMSDPDQEGFWDLLGENHGCRSYQSGRTSKNRSHQ